MAGRRETRVDSFALRLAHDYVQVKNALRKIIEVFKWETNPQPSTYRGAVLLIKLTKHHTKPTNFVFDSAFLDHTTAMSEFTAKGVCFKASDR